MMHISGTFDYAFIVPAGPPSGTRRIEGTLRQPLQDREHRLIGHAPLLVTDEYQREDWQLYSRITLTPTDRKATAQSFSFTIDRAMITMLCQGDALHISRTACAGLGLSVLRDGQLVAAAGAISAMPLGRDVSIGTPRDLVRQAERIFQTRDPEYQLLRCPVELRIGNLTRIIDSGRSTIGCYEILIQHGFIIGIPGIDACVSIERTGDGPDTGAHRSGELISQGEGERLISKQ